MAPPNKIVSCASINTRYLNNILRFESRCVNGVQEIDDPPSPGNYYQKHSCGQILSGQALQIVLNVYSKLRQWYPNTQVGEASTVTGALTGVGSRTVLNVKKRFKELCEKDAAFLPEQLQPAKRTRARRKRKDNNATSAGASTKKWKEDDIEQKLRALEETEGKAENEESTVEDDRLRKKIKQEQDSEDQEVEEEVEDEEELEEETDYVAGYFDNGESYLDEEDDNLDDGPVY
ncbi:DNA-directed RNA polymerase III subunit RPC7-like isoform X3 [Ornithodoros turicata]|uniref:DNA-directed RNA polymerase III subunit RPC7-like isoform X3 n=1 Tax=Ornithodoros turicata TaxID=34597 RepID=UPI00313A25A3